jgi:bifunctional N-acetylglucosamine-1-phosphate-uridyltransferase/glucosamine-1-phosphate-acetyltransferase GlmU-like protein
MSGIGKRFQNFGFKEPKFLINVLGKSIINHVVDMFPKIDDVIFIVNKNHYNDPEYNLKEHLKKIAPNSKIFEIEEHEKGPGWAIIKAKDLIDLDRPVIVNYCDFNSIFDYDKLEKELSSGIAGLILTYDGFHPHLIRSNQFAYVKKNQKHNVVEIQEKKPFTDNPKEEEASTGTYCFKTGKILLDALEDQIENNDNLNGEYYISLTYKSMLRKEMEIKTLKVTYFMQWGTPQDLNDFNYWADVFNRLMETDITLCLKSKTIKLILAAGNGKRFKDAGYKKDKTLLNFLGKPIIERILQIYGIDRSKILLKKSQTELITFLTSLPAELIELEIDTQGQAESAYLGMKNLEDQPLLISSCDSILVSKELADFGESNADLLIYTTKRLPNSDLNPTQYGWVHCEKNTTEINKVKVKECPDNDDWDIFTGAILVKSSKKLTELIEVLFAEDKKINREYYLDSVIEVAINAGLKVKKKEADLFISLGTPNEYESFNYWHNCFKEWKFHPYGLSQSPPFNYS